VTGFAMMVFGNALTHGTAATIWELIRWPLGFVLLAGAIALMFMWSPNRRQPAWSWLVYGAAIAVALTVISTLVLAWFFGWSHTFGQTYGPLAGMVALLIWLMLVSVSVLFGAAVAAQLEAVRASVPEPQDVSKATDSVPLDGRRTSAAA